MLCLQPTCIVEDDLHVAPHGRCNGTMRMAKGEVCIIDDDALFQCNGLRKAGSGSLWDQACFVQPSSKEAAVPRPAANSMEVICLGFGIVGMHTEYIFRVSHNCGCNWKVQRRYSTLLALHDDLMGTLKSLPAFPQKASISQHLTSDREVAMQRAMALQRYFQLLVLRGDVLGLPKVMEALGARKPEAVRSVRVTRWDRASDSELAAELDIQANVQSENCCCPVDGFQVQVRVPPSHKGIGCPTGRSVDGTVFTTSVGKTVRIPVMLDDTELELHVYAWNALGSSPPVSIKVAVPWRDSPRYFSTNSPFAPLPDLAAEGNMPSDGRSPCKGLSPGSLVEAIWAGDGRWYNAVVRHVDEPWGWVVVDWLRPRPLTGEQLRCVCEVGDDTSHRRVLPSHVRSVSSAGRRLGLSQKPFAKDGRHCVRESI